MCLSLCLLQEGVEASPLLWSGTGGLVWSVGDAGLREKKPSGYLYRTGPLVTTGWFCHKKNWGKAEVEEAAGSPLSSMPLLSRGEALNIRKREIAKRKNGKAINQETL